MPEQAEYFTHKPMFAYFARESKSVWNEMDQFTESDDEHLIWHCFLRRR